MITVVIVDDEVANHSYLERLVSNYTHLNWIGSFSSATKALNFILEKKPDLIFLDIEMPIISGIEMAYEIKSKCPHTQIIFVTAYPEHAVDAFKIGAVHYLLKPVSLKDFESAIERVGHFEKATVESDKKKWHIHMLGTYKLFNSENNKNISWPTKKAEELFAYLVYQNGKMVEKGILWDLLWEEVEERRTQRYLHNEIYRLKNTLKAEGIEAQINYQNGAYSLDLTDFECDVLKLEKFIASKIVLTQDTLSLYEQMFELYKGDLLQTRDYLWALPWQQSVALGFKQMAMELIEFYIANGRLNEAEKKLRTLLYSTPWDEDYFEKLLKVYYLVGDRVKLKSSFEMFRAVIHKELNTAPRLSLSQLYDRYFSELHRPI